MRILKISNMYPSRQKQYAGIFVKNQYETLLGLIGTEDRLDIFYMKRAFTSGIGSVLKYGWTFVRFVPYLFRRYDIVHLHYFYPLIWLAWAYRKLHPKTRVVVTFLGRDINAQVHSGNAGLYRRIARAVDFSIPVGITMADTVREKLGLERMEVLPCGVNEHVFYPEPGTEKKYDFIFVGSFIHRKGIDTVIEAIRSLPPDSGIRFCFCGSGPYLGEMQALGERYSIDIRQNQTQDQLRGLLNASRFFLLMSRGEGFATATTEAFFCGVPVLTSDIDNFKEQVAIGVNGYISPLEDAGALRAKLSELATLDDTQYARLSQGALESFRDAGLHRVCSRILEIYRMLCRET